LTDLLNILRFYRIEMNVEKSKVMRISGQPSSVQIMTEKKQLENSKYFNYLGSMVTYAAR